MDDEELPAWRPPVPVVLPVRLDPLGRAGPTRSAARGRRWRRTCHGWYVPSWVDPTVPEQRVAEAVPHLSLGGVVTGWGALRMRGAHFLDGRAHDHSTLWPVTLAQGWHAAPRPPGAGVRQHQLRVGDCSVVGGVPVHAAVPALVDEMRLAPDLAHAVVCADAARAARLVTGLEMSETLAAGAGWLGIDQARRAWELSRDGVRSPPESRLRLVGREVDLTDLLVNVPVFSLDGRLLGYPDLLDAVAGLALEYDGAGHRSVARQRSDNLREEQLRAHAIEVLRVTSLDLARPLALGRRVLDVRARCAFLAPHARAWTLRPPPGWRPPPGR
ncbi:hypothetical protein G7072_19550 [Nocardioides sp. HDW12B]|uniref:hypothetical protein n=1 Tax=Nocardioides sp. HDW12B TaxID=2714939 RepID=UPI00140A3370|nr:hypothetical protein [Nocardioides sp. HDW12B]QIK68244.1 hypothetical protein G7072_19550 [Nocardioides sp. HDW12B]